MGNEWKADGSGVMSDGSVGGDIQAGEAWSVRFVPAFEQPNADGEYAVVTEYWYATDDWSGNRDRWIQDIEPQGNDDEIEHRWNHRFGVQCMIEFVLCKDLDDIGSTEVWSDYQYYDDALYYSLERAQEESKSRAQSSERQNGWDIMWDGVAR